MESFLLNRLEEPIDDTIPITEELAETEQSRNFESSDKGRIIVHDIIVVLSFFLIICTLPFSLCICFKVVMDHERAVVFRLGRSLTKRSASGPGIIFVIPCTDTCYKVDLRTVSYDLEPQEILSKDSVTVSVDAVVNYRVSDPVVAVSHVLHYDQSTYLLAATTLRTVLSTKRLSEILSQRQQISQIIQARLDEATSQFGVKVVSVEINDVRLPPKMQRAMVTEAEAAREATAKVIAAQGEQNACRILKEAADIIAESPGAMQMCYLQTLKNISSEKTTTIVFPLPMEIFRGMH